MQECGWKCICDSKEKFQRITFEIKFTHILFLLDVVVCYCILHNMILDGKDLDIQTLMIQLELENKHNVDGVLDGKEGNWRILVGQDASIEIDLDF